MKNARCTSFLGGGWDRRSERPRGGSEPFVSQSLGKLPVPTVNDSGCGAAVDACGRWAVDEGGTRLIMLHVCTMVIK